MHEDRSDYDAGKQLSVWAGVSHLIPHQHGPAQVLRTWSSSQTAVQSLMEMRLHFCLFPLIVFAHIPIQMFLTSTLYLF